VTLSIGLPLGLQTYLFYRGKDLQASL
jgi:hypothetical protein